MKLAQMLKLVEELWQSYRVARIILLIYKRIVYFGIIQIIDMDRGVKFLQCFPNNNNSHTCLFKMSQWPIYVFFHISIRESQNH